MEYVAYKVSEKQTEMMNCSRKKGIGERPGGEGVEGDNGQRHRSRAPAGNDASLYLPLSSSTASWDALHVYTPLEQREPKSLRPPPCLR